MKQVTTYNYEELKDALLDYHIRIFGKPPLGHRYVAYCYDYSYRVETEELSPNEVEVDSGNYTI